MKKSTTEEFIEKAKEIHGDKYDYSLVEYISRNYEVKIICPVHGVFYQTPNSHLSGNGCSKCSNKYHYSENDFLEKAKNIHNNKYNYSLVNFINSKINIDIICPIHGKFSQKPNLHLIGHGCKKCANKLLSNLKLSNINNFIYKFKIIHNDKYDYSLAEYKNAKTPIKIICSIHGEFEQLPFNHLKGCGCTKCGTINSSKKQTSNTEEFIIHSKKIHNDKYDYSLVNYINNTTKIKIICPEHGIFEQTPSDHKRNRGCSICGNSSMKNKQMLGSKEFIKRSKKLYGDKFDYSLVEYKNWSTKVKIICPEHGVFEQIAGRHYNGFSCPICNVLSYNNKFLYFFYDEIYNIMKIGVSSSPEKRLNKIVGNNINNIIILKTYEKSGKLENELHKKYAQYRTEHIIYEDGKTEWFNLDKNEIINIDIFVKSYIEDNSDYNQ